MRVEGFRHLVADFYHLRAEQQISAHRAAAERRKRVIELIDQHIHDDNWRALLHQARQAAEHGEKEFLLLRFPRELLSDGGRAVNAPEPDWPQTLRGEAAEIHLRGERDLKPRGFGVLPLLREAECASVFSAPGPENDGATGAGLAEALSRQGIPVHQAIVREEGNPVGAALLATAADSGATLIVMGAYTHSRLRQSFLCGVTMHVLEHTAVPVVMTH